MLAIVAECLVTRVVFSSAATLTLVLTAERLFILVRLYYYNNNNTGTKIILLCLWI